MTESSEQIIRNEWDLLKKSGLLSQIGCTAGPQRKGKIYNMFKWNALMRAPKKSPYNGYMFKFEIDFPKDYPNSPPDVYCKTNIYHMNINKSGKVCVQSITEDDKWQIRHDISTVLLSIFIIFDKPNPSSPYQSEIAKLYLNNIEEYKKNVKENCEKYAIKIPE
jgi:ubiquitin-protein ligase